VWRDPPDTRGGGTRPATSNFQLQTSNLTRSSPLDGSLGWDDYAPFYDWENARTLGRRDVGFWRDLVRRQSGPVLELGCGTGRLLAPLARTGIPLVGVDRSAAMLAAARLRARRLLVRHRPRVARADIRALPFPDATFDMVIAPYGMLQSLVTDAALEATLAEAVRVLRPGGLLGADLVPDLPAWAEYRPQVRMRGRAAGGRTLTLIEAVRQDRRRGLTVFEEEFVERRGRTERRHQFSLVFRTLPLGEMVGRLQRAGLVIEAVLGDYRGRPLDERADAWIVLARTPAAERPKRPIPRAKIGVPRRGRLKER